jgi:hypothetical protein
MPLQKILFKPGVNRENTRYTTEGGWYECDKIRFRQGNPEIIGGWTRISPFTFLGVCRSLWNWVTLGGANYVGVGTNLKFYIESGGYYNDITPIRDTATLPINPFTGNGTTTVTVYSPANGAIAGDFVTFNQVGGTYALLLNAEYQITNIIDADHYNITTATAVAVGATGGASVIAAYQLNIGPAIQASLTGWGAGYWGNNTWGNSSGETAIRLWSQTNYGQDLLFCPNGSELYYWQAANGLAVRGVPLNSLGGAVTISLASPAVITSSRLFTEGTALQFGGNLPTGMTADTTYYVFNVNGLSFNLLDSAGNLVSTSVAPPLIGNTARGNVGTMTASVSTNTVALSGVSATGALGGTNIINLTLRGVSASGSLGSVIANGRAVTGVSASGQVGTVAANVVSVALTGNAAYANVGAVGVSGVVNAYISRIVDVPIVQNFITVSDVSRFALSFGANDYGSDIQDPMLIRWSAQDDIYNWTPDPTNQAGFTRLSHGSKIVAAVQTRQEIVVFTDSTVYSLQYLGPPYVWAPQLLGDNVSIAGQNSAIIASGVVYWMGVDKFYSYDGRVNTLNCDLRRYVFSDINQSQRDQFFCGTNEGFNEVWWFYCSITGPNGTGTAANPNTTVDRYVVYNYLEKVWYYGTMARTAWLDSGLRDYPVAATYSYNLVNHEQGKNNNETGTAVAIDAYISSSEFDLGDGHNFGFVWRVLPDLTFENAENTPTGILPSVSMTLYGLSNSGSGATSTASQPVAKSNTYVITEQFTGQIFTRMRGRQMIFKISSNQINTCWQLGAPRIDIRPDGRR